MMMTEQTPPTMSAAPGGIIHLRGKEWIIDFEMGRETYLRPVVDGIAYLPGIRVETAELEDQTRKDNK